MIEFSMNKKITLICVNSQTVLNFRLPMIRALQNNCYEVSVISFDSQHREEIQKNGIDFYLIKDKNRSLNPIKLLSLKNEIKSILKIISPDVVFTFMLKPNIFGVSAAKSLGIKNVFSMVEGLGDVFINNSVKWKIIRSFVSNRYKKSFSYAQKVFFLNFDDRAELISRKLVDPEKAELIPGIGVDLERFSYKPVTNTKSFLMIARMLKTKGVFEYCEAAKIVKSKYPEAEFFYLGAEGTVTLEDIKQYVDTGIINYLGTSKDVRPFIERCGTFVLPSYREGFPVTVMEASAMGRCVLTNDTAGCRDSVKDGFNGFVIKNNSVEAYAEKMFMLIESPETVVSMGKNSRVYAEENFDQVAINNQLLSYLESI